MQGPWRHPGTSCPEGRQEWLRLQLQEHPLFPLSGDSLLLDPQALLSQWQCPLLTVIEMEGLKGETRALSTASFPLPQEHAQRLHPGCCGQDTWPYVRHSHRQLGGRIDWQCRGHLGEGVTCTRISRCVGP